MKNQVKKKERKKKKPWVYPRRHVIANSEKWYARGSRADKTNEGISIMNGGGVEKSGCRLGECPHRQKQSFSVFLPCASPCLPIPFSFPFPFASLSHQGLNELHPLVVKLK